MGADVSKQYMDLCGKPVIYYSLKAFEDSFVDHIVLVCGMGEEQAVKTMLEGLNLDSRIVISGREEDEEAQLDRRRRKTILITAGGKERYHSVHNGILASPQSDYILIHDGARPFVDSSILEGIKQELNRYDAVIAAVKSKDTVKIADENGIVQQTPQRSSVWNMQTPQCFRASMIRDAYERLIQSEQELIQNGIQITDDAMVLEQFSSVPIKLYESSYENFKITTPEDMLLANQVVEKRRNMI